MLKIRWKGRNESRRAEKTVPIIQIGGTDGTDGRQGGHSGGGHLHNSFQAGAQRTSVESERKRSEG